MRNDQLFTELTNLPFNASVEIQGVDDNDEIVSFIATSVNYNAHTNTIVIGGS